MQQCKTFTLSTLIYSGSPTKRDRHSEVGACLFLLVMRSAREPTQNALRFEYGFVFATRRSASLFARRRVSKYSPAAKFPYAGEKSCFFFSRDWWPVRSSNPAQISQGEFVLWVRNIAPPLPCRKPCRAEQIPVQKARGFCVLLLFLLPPQVQVYSPAAKFPYAGEKSCFSFFCWWYPMDKMYSPDNRPSDIELKEMKTLLATELDKLL